MTACGQENIRVSSQASRTINLKCGNEDFLLCTLNPESVWSQIPWKIKIMLWQEICWKERNILSSFSLFWSINGGEWFWNAEVSEKINCGNKSDNLRFCVCANWCWSRYFPLILFIAIFWRLAMNLSLNFRFSKMCQQILDEARRHLQSINLCLK